MMPFSSGAVTRSTFRYVCSHWLLCWRGLWLPLLLLFIAAVFLGRRLLCLVSGLCSVRYFGLQPTAEIGLWIVVLILAALILLSMMEAVIWRFMLKAVPVTGFFYLRIGGDELRLILLGIVKAVLVFLAAAIVAALAGAIVFAIRHFLGTFSTIAAVIGVYLTLVIAAYFEARLSLAGPASIDKGGLPLGTSWRATRKSVFRLRRVDFWTMLPVLLLGVLVILAFFASLYLAPALAGWTTLFATLPFDQACARLLSALGPRLAVLFVLLYLVALLFWSVAIVARALLFQAATAAPSGPPTP